MGLKPFPLCPSAALRGEQTTFCSSFHHHHRRLPPLVRAGLTGSCRILTFHPTEHNLPTCRSHDSPPPPLTHAHSLRQNVTDSETEVVFVFSFFSLAPAYGHPLCVCLSVCHYSKSEGSPALSQRPSGWDGCSRCWSPGQNGFPPAESSFSWPP